MYFQKGASIKSFKQIFWGHFEGYWRKEKEPQPNPYQYATDPKHWNMDKPDISNYFRLYRYFARISPHIQYMTMFTNSSPLLCLGVGIYGQTHTRLRKRPNLSNSVFEYSKFSVEQVPLWFIAIERTHTYTLIVGCIHRDKVKIEHQPGADII